MLVFVEIFGFIWKIKFFFVLKFLVYGVMVGLRFIGLSAMLFGICWVVVLSIVVKGFVSIIDCGVVEDCWFVGEGYIVILFGFGCWVWIWFDCESIIS